MRLRARASASICCSPPDSMPPRTSSRGSSSGNSASAPSTEPPPMPQVVASRHLREHQSLLGDEPDAAVADPLVHGRERRHVPNIDQSVDRRQFAGDRQQRGVVLPAPFGPSRHTTSPAWTVRLTARHHLAAEVAGLELARLEQVGAADHVRHPPATGAAADDGGRHAARSPCAVGERISLVVCLVAQVGGDHGRVVAHLTPGRARSRSACRSRARRLGRTLPSRSSCRARRPGSPCPSRRPAAARPGPAPSLSTSS